MSKLVRCCTINLIISSWRPMENITVYMDVITCSKSNDQPGKVAVPARVQLSKYSTELGTVHHTPYLLL